MPAEYEKFVKDNYATIRHEELVQRGAGMVLLDDGISQANSKSMFDVSEEERTEVLEYYWRTGAATHMSRSFFGLNIDPAANDVLRSFWIEKIRDLVKDPALAEKLIPEHPPLTRRACGVYGYYETFNSSDVSLVDCKANPIARIVPEGVELADGSRIELDVLAFATGFDAGAGALKQIDIVGRDGITLTDAWADGVKTHLGMMISGFPNMFSLGGSQSPAAHFSPPLLVYYQTQFVIRLLDVMRDNGLSTVEPRPQTVEDWCDHVAEVVNRTLVVNSTGWWMGANIPGKKRRVISYMGGFTAYRDRCDKAVANNLQEYLVAELASAGR